YNAQLVNGYSEHEFPILNENLRLYSASSNLPPFQRFFHIRNRSWQSRHRSISYAILPYIPLSINGLTINCSRSPWTSQLLHGNVATLASLLSHTLKRFLLPSNIYFHVL